MGNVSVEDIIILSKQLGLTVTDISNPVYLTSNQVKCNRCGACCKNIDGVNVSLIDIFKISEHLDRTPKNFVKVFCRESDNIINLFEEGPYKGILIATQNGICPFFKGSIGCTINDLKPLKCKLYPLSNLAVTRACILKMQKLKDGDTYKRCSIFDLPNNAVIVPDFRMLAVEYLLKYKTQEYCAQKESKWQQKLAQTEKDESIKLITDENIIKQYSQLIKSRFDEIDQHNANLLIKMLSN